MSPDSAAPTKAPHHESAVRELVVHLGCSDPYRVIRAEGGVNVEMLTRNQPVEGGIAIAGMLFAVCPVAQTAAYMGATEAALGHKLSEDAATARAKAVLSETLAAAVWRHCISWPQLIGASPDMATTKKARRAADAYRQSLFNGDWKTLGGVPHAPAAFIDLQALEVLTRLVRETAQGADALLRACPDYAMTAPILPLGKNLTNPNATPTTACFEETPRANQGDHSYPRPLKDWLKAQETQALSLAEFAGNDPEIAAYGAGLPQGVVETIRGRLRHRVTLNGQQIETWAVAAPTDWNFAINGPVARHMVDVSDPTLGAWIIAAFDPCRHARLEKAASHA